VEIIVDHGGLQRELDLEIEHPHACVADLLEAVEVGLASSGAGVVIEGRFFDANVGLDEIGLFEGAVLGVAREAPGRAQPANGPVLAIVGGPVAGTIHHLDSRPLVIGRDDACGIALRDPTVSTRHARLDLDPDNGELVVSDLGSHNGTWIDGQPVAGPVPVTPGTILRFGAVQARLVTSLPDDRPIAVDPLNRAVGGLVPFNRPPRPAPEEGQPPIKAPEPPQKRSGSPAFSIVMIVAPLLMGGLLILIYREPRFAAFMLLSPVMGIGNWWATKRRAKKEHRTRGKEFQQALTSLDEELGRSVAAETQQREQRLPDPAETLRRALAPSIQLWQRRPGHGDFLRLRAGIGDVAWDPPVVAGREGLDEDVEAVVAPHRTLPRAPVEIDLSGGGVVGLVGDRTAALALARSLVCQAAVHHGPADLGMVVLASEPHAMSWDWVKWLPHVRDVTGATRLLAGNRAASDELVEALSEATAESEDPKPRLRSLAGDDTPAGRTRLFVVDDVSLIEGRRAPTRLLLRGTSQPAAGIVIAPSEDQLPAVCNAVVELRSELGDADLRRPQERVRIDDFVIAGIEEATARHVARTLARYEDPELEIAGAGLPQLVRLLPLLEMDEVDADAVVKTWGCGLPHPAPATPIGMGEGGVMWLDLDRDGPHGLVGGTTGSGKSALLRSFIAGLAARVSPDHLVFVLVDYKGGSAFDACARLPHVVGMVTDLDEHLGARALTSLEAELSHRERVLRQAGADDLQAYLRSGADLGRLPRLVVVIDEFATLAKELPDFLGALVDIAQRGRTLGVHLVLATQRPAGVVNANIKANTNLRIALRVQDAGDSTDIIDRKDAVSIPPSQPGRAYVRRGPSDVVLVQTALATASASERRSSGVRLAPFRFGPVASNPGMDGQSGPTDLVRLVAAVQRAFDHLGLEPPRKPWLEMLPDRIELDDVLESHDVAEQAVPFGLADEPTLQRRVPVTWKPAEGHLGLFGMVGSGTTTALLAVARALVERHSPDTCHLYAVDFGSGGLSPLAKLPHVGAVVTAADHEAQFRLIRRLRHELDRRRALSPAERAIQPMIVVLVDGVGAFLAEHEGVEGTDVTDTFRRVFSEGPGTGIVFVVTGDRPASLPVRLASLVSQKVLFRLADDNDFSAIGVRPRELPKFVPGRAIHGVSKLVFQVGHPGEDAGAVPAPWAEEGDSSHIPYRIQSLPAVLAFDDLPGGATVDGATAEVTLGLRDEDLGPAVLALDVNDHVLVAGSPRSGKTSTLVLMASLLRAADPGAVLIGICHERSPLYELEALDAAGTIAQLAHVVRAAPSDERLWFILVDDAPAVADVDRLLTSAVQSGRPGLHVVAAGRSDDVRGGYGHWSRQIRQSRTGILLKPNPVTDGELLGARLPRRLHVPLVTGRGFLVAGGEPSLVQIALPPEPAGPGPGGHGGT